MNALDWDSLINTLSWLSDPANKKSKLYSSNSEKASLMIKSNLPYIREISDFHSANLNLPSMQISSSSEPMTISLGDGAFEANITIANNILKLFKQIDTYKGLYFKYMESNLASINEIAHSKLDIEGKNMLISALSKERLDLLRFINDINDWFLSTMYSGTKEEDIDTAYKLFEYRFAMFRGR